jgi:hypothetical protein
MAPREGLVRQTAQREPMTERRDGQRRNRAPMEGQPENRPTSRPTAIPGAVIQTVAVRAAPGGADPTARPGRSALRSMPLDHARAAPRSSITRPAPRSRDALRHHGARHALPTTTVQPDRFPGARVAASCTSSLNLVQNQGDRVSVHYGVRIWGLTRRRRQSSDGPAQCFLAHGSS